MGAEASQLSIVESDLITSHSVGSYSVDQVFWAVHDFELDEEPVSVLAHRLDDDPFSFDHLLEPLKHMKSVRHPNLLKVSDIQYGDSVVMLVTEKVSPLLEIVDSLTSYEISAGLFSILQAVKFLHEKCDLCHGSISPAAIFITANGDWKLGGFETCCKQVDFSFTNLKPFKKYRNSFAAPEEKANRANKQTARCLDVYNLGKLSEFLLPYLEEMDGVRGFEDLVESMLSATPRERPQLSAIINCEFFKLNPFLEMCDFMSNILLKTDREKEDFFSSLLPRLRELPEILVASRLSRLLLSRFVVLCPQARQHVLPALLSARPESLKPAVGLPLLTEPMFRTHVLPRLFKMFSVHEAQLRMTLLLSLHQYAPLFDIDSLASLLPQILLGLRDTDDQLVAATLVALASLVPLLGANTVVGTNRERLFVSAKPTTAKASKEKFDVNSFRNVADIILDSHHSKPKDTESAREQLSFARLERDQKRDEQRKRAEARRLKREQIIAERNKPKPATLLEMAEKSKAKRLSDTASMKSLWSIVYADDPDVPDDVKRMQGSTTHLSTTQGSTTGSEIIEAQMISVGDMSDCKPTAGHEITSEPDNTSTDTSSEPVVRSDLLAVDAGACELEDDTGWEDWGDTELDTDNLTLEIITDDVGQERISEAESRDQALEIDLAEEVQPDNLDLHESPTTVNEVVGSAEDCHTLVCAVRGKLTEDEVSSGSGERNELDELTESDRDTHRESLIESFKSDISNYDTTAQSKDTSNEPVHGSPASTSSVETVSINSKATSSIPAEVTQTIAAKTAISTTSTETLPEKTSHAETMPTVAEPNITKPIVTPTASISTEAILMSTIPAETVSSTKPSAWKEVSPTVKKAAGKGGPLKLPTRKASKKNSERSPANTTDSDRIKVEEVAAGVLTSSGIKQATKTQADDFFTSLLSSDPSCSDISSESLVTSKSQQPPVSDRLALKVNTEDEAEDAGDWGNFDWDD